MLNSYRSLVAKAAVAIFGLLAGVASAQDLPGLSNFHKVNPQIYRGAQPSTEGFQQLAKLGIKTIIDLREADDRSAAEKKVVEAAGMHYVNVPMRGYHTPTAEQVNEVLNIFNDQSAGPVFVHCRRGADRTGAVVAAYRISHDGWENAKALSEARSLGMSWTQRAIMSYVLSYKADKPTTTVARSQPAPTPAVTAAPALAVTPVQ